MSFLDGPLVFVDVETTGMSYSRGRVIEVAAIRVEKGEIVDSFSSLVDPEMALPEFITSLTGITNQELSRAPSFYDISNKLYEIMRDAVFVAHNVRFDYGFLKQEFKRLGKQFNPKLLCTVRLSKALYSGSRGHRLQDLIDRCDIKVSARHRAFDDAKVMWQFIQHVQVNFPAPAIESAIQRQLKAPAIPKNLEAETIKNLPELPGVYIFYDRSASPLYIGKSINIKKRVMSHFSADHQSETEFKITQQVDNIEFQITDGELTALLLESKLIKTMQPVYNRQLRRHQKLTLAKQQINPTGYISLGIEDSLSIDPDSLGDILGVYTTKGKARDFINQITKDFGLCPKLMGLDKSRSSCFAYQLKKCHGACLGKESTEAYNQRLLLAFEGRRMQEWPYDSPVLIMEKNDSDNVSSIIVDQWCVIASLKQEAECEPELKFQNKMFDIDTYKILRSYLSGKAQSLIIRPISYEALSSFG